MKDYIEKINRFILAGLRNKIGKKRNARKLAKAYQTSGAVKEEDLLTFY